MSLNVIKVLFAIFTIIVLFHISNLISQISFVTPEILGFANLFLVMFGIACITNVVSIQPYKDED